MSKRFFVLVNTSGQYFYCGEGYYIGWYDGLNNATIFDTDFYKSFTKFYYFGCAYKKQFIYFK